MAAAVSGGHPRQLATVCTTGALGGDYARLSPDGRRLLVVSANTTSGRPSYRIVDVTRGTRSVIAGPPARRRERVLGAGRPHRVPDPQRGPRTRRRHQSGRSRHNDARSARTRRTCRSRVPHIARRSPPRFRRNYRHPRPRCHGRRERRGPADDRHEQRTSGSRPLLVQRRPDRAGDQDRSACPGDTRPARCSPARSVPRAARGLPGRTELQLARRSPPGSRLIAVAWASVPSPALLPPVMGRDARPRPIRLP